MFRFIEQYIQCDTICRSDRNSPNGDRTVYSSNYAVRWFHFFPDQAFRMLEGNHLSGPIPTEIGLLTRLDMLLVHNKTIANRYLGISLEITSLDPFRPRLGTSERQSLNCNHLIANISERSFRQIDGTTVSGPLPTEIGRLTNLMFVYVLFKTLF